MYGPLMAGLPPDTQYKKLHNALIKNKHVNGFTLFDKNFLSVHQLKEMISFIRQVRYENGLKTLFSVDYEGGAIQRFSGESFTKIPSANDLGNFYLKNKPDAVELMKQIGLVISTELGRCGIDLCLGPCVDLNTNYACKTTGRAYSDSSIIVIELAKSLLCSFAHNKMNAVIKHFPGFGAVLVDTHFHMPVLKDTLESLEKSHLSVFIELFDSTHVPAVMLSHGVFPRIDVRPIPISPKWINDLLRSKFKFNGIVITDCLAMAGAKPLGSTYPDKVINCINVGCDIVLLARSIMAQKIILAKLASPNVTDSELFLTSSMVRNKRLSALHPPDPDYFENVLESDLYRDARENIVEWIRINNGGRKKFFHSKNKIIQTYFENPLKQFLKRNLTIWGFILSIYSAVNRLIGLFKISP